MKKILKNLVMFIVGFAISIPAGFPFVVLMTAIGAAVVAVWVYATIRRDADERESNGFSRIILRWAELVTLSDLGLKKAERVGFWVGTLISLFVWMV